MKREIAINASALEVRVALLEDGSLTELYLERQQHRGLAGNIYKGKVTRVLPGMQAAFVDIGLEKAGFLHVSDFHDDVQAVGSIAEVIGEDDVETYPVDGDGDGGSDEAKSPQDLQELAELEDLEEPSEGQTDRQDDRRDYPPDEQAERRSARPDVRQDLRPNVRQDVRQGARQPTQPDARRRDVQQSVEESSAEENIEIDRRDLGDAAAAAPVEGEAEAAAPTAEGEAGAAPGTKRRRSRRRRRRGGKAHKRRPRVHEQRSRLPIEQQLHRNQEIIVQIAKEPMGTKGARLTSSISLPGRHLVYMPTSGHVGVSRRIGSAEERARLRAAVKELGRVQGGFIVRTACEGVSKREIQRDANFLTRLWGSILAKSESSPPASILYSDLDVALRTVRDLFSSEIDKLWCDDPETFERIVQFVQHYMPRLRARLTMYQGAEPIFDHFKIEPQIERALDRKVWLKSGGYLVFDQAEALTAIDVNTGRFVGKTNQDETVLRTNLEAAEEVVKQLRLRNIGGIIIVDFIDMSREADRKKVSDVLREAQRRDKARTSALKISELGLVQMTRKRTRESLEELLTDSCPHCEGRRVVKSVPTLAAEVLRGVHREARRRSGDDMLLVKVHPAVARYLYDHGARDLEALERRVGIKIVLRAMEGLEPGSFELSLVPAAA
ncbi:MAG TPA: Rne/Rng family ribonuclease [Candidatus Binataceae bacterium]|nr:Rne/Rng family ribonuclease [Candidatus Binataceae bacterium]